MADDLSTLQGLLAQFQPSEQDKADARRAALLSASLGLLGARKGYELDRLGQAGLLGVNTYQNAIKQAQTERGQNLTQAGALMDILRRQQFANQLTGGAVPAVGVNAGGGASSAMPSGGMSGGAMPMSAAAPAPSQPKSMRDQLLDMGIPEVAINAAANSKDPVTAINDLVKEFAKPTMGAGNIPMIRGRNNSFTAAPAQGYNDALAAQTLAQTAAGEQAKLPYNLQSMNLPAGGTQQLYGDQLQAMLRGNNGMPVQGAEGLAGQAPSAAQQDLISVPIGNGQTRMMTRADAARLFSQTQPQTGRPGVSMNAPDDATARALALAADRNGQQVTTTVAPKLPQLGGMGGLGVTPNPLAMKQAEGAIQSQTAQNTLIGEGQGKDYLNVLESEKQAPGNIAKYELMKNYLSKVDTGKLAPSVLGLKSIAAYVAPNLAKDWTKDVPYAQASAALSNEIALQLRNPSGGAGMPGSMSDSDRNFLVSMTANAANDPRAIPMMLDARIAMEKRAQEVGQIARAYRKQNGTLDEGFYQALQDFSNAHPMFKGMDTGGAAPSGWSIKRIN